MPMNGSKGAEFQPSFQKNESKVDLLGWPAEPYKFGQKFESTTSCEFSYRELKTQK